MIRKVEKKERGKEIRDNLIAATLVLAIGFIVLLPIFLLGFIEKLSPTLAYDLLGGFGIIALVASVYGLIYIGRKNNKAFIRRGKLFLLEQRIKQRSKFFEYLLPNKYSKKADFLKNILSLLGSSLFIFVASVFVFYGNWIAGVYSLFPSLLLGYLFYCYRDCYFDDKVSFENKCVTLGIKANSRSEIYKEERRLQREKEKERYLHKRQVDRLSWKELYEEKLKIEERLQHMTDGYLYLFGGMPKVKVYLTALPVKSGKIYDIPDSVAFACGDEIFIKKEHYNEASQDSLIKTIKHEMTHCWIYWKKIKVKDPHGLEFQTKFAEAMKQP